MSSGVVAEQFDIVVIGGGLVGLTFVRLLAASSENLAVVPRIALIEAKPPRQQPGIAEHLRVSALAPAMRNVLTLTGVWESLDADDFCAFTDMYVWQADAASSRSRALEFSAAELGVAELGYIVRNHVMRMAAWSGLDALPKIELIAEDAPQSLEQVSAGWTITLASNVRVQTRLLIGADGIHSWVRQSLGMERNAIAHAQRAIVAQIATEHHHGHTARQRFLPGGPVALLPLANGDCSLVWSCAETQAERLLAASRASFAAQLGEATNHVLGDLECISERLSFALASSHAQRYTGRRFALLGDAAHQVHPLAGQGLNLGLLDAAVLADKLATHLRLRAADPGDRLVLRRYERARKGDNLLTRNLLMGLNRLFSSELATVAGVGLDLLDRAAPLKRLLARYAMGQFRQPPSATHLGMRHESS